jgi:hypothetical protein
LSRIDAHKELGNRATASREGNMPIIDNLKSAMWLLAKVSQRLLNRRFATMREALGRHHQPWLYCERR